MFVLLGMAVMGGMDAFATNYIWDNGAGDNNFINPENWVGDTLPTNSARDYMRISMTGADKAILSEGSLSNFTAVMISMKYDDVSADGEFLQTGGLLEAYQNGNDLCRIAENGSVGLWTQTGGTSEVNAIQIALGTTTGTTGTLAVAGGDMTVRGARYDYSIHLPADSRVAGFVEISGGTLNTRAGIYLGNSGTFTVIGAEATEINIGGQGDDGRWVHEAGGTLAVQIGSNGISQINVLDDGQGDYYGDVWFDAGALLDVSFMEGYAETGTWSIMEFGGDFVNLGLQFADGVDTNMWDVGVLSNQLVVSYGEDAPDLPLVTIPEAPEGLYALPDNNNLVSVYWDTSDLAESYTVYRSEDDSSYSEIISGVAENYFVDTNVVNGTTYYYKVSGVNESGEGDLSDSDPALPTPYYIMGTDGTYNNNKSFTKHQLFDGDIDTYFDSSESGTSWAGLDFGEGNEQQIYEISFVIRGGWDSAYPRSEGAYIEGANISDFSDAVLLHTVSTNTADNYPAVNRVAVQNTTLFRYVRLHAPPSYPLYSFAELDFTLGSDFTAQGTSIPWLEEYGLSEADEFVDNDGDGLLTWEEYVAGTIPTDSTSVLELNSITSTPNGLVLVWQSIEGKKYSINTYTSLDYPVSGVLVSDIIGVAGETAYTTTVSEVDTIFYDIGVE